MSYPISACLVVKAALGDEQAYTKLRDAMIYNLKCGHWSQIPCGHVPLCECSDEQLERFHERIKVDVYDLREREVNEAVLVFDKDETKINEAYASCVKYCDSFSSQVEGSNCPTGAVGPSSDSNDWRSGQILHAMITMYAARLARNCAARKDKKHFKNLLDELHRYGTQFKVMEDSDDQVENYPSSNPTAGQRDKEDPKRPQGKP